jgi:hypothetical protein
MARGEARSNAKPPSDLNASRALRDDRLLDLSAGKSEKNPDTFFFSRDFSND